LAALIGDVGDESAALERTRSQKPRADRIRQTQSAQSAPAFRRDRSRRARRLDPRARHHPADSSCAPVRGAIDQYEIVAGERRWRAAQRAGLHDVPVVLLEVSDREALELAIIENVQRADLNALEEAAAIRRSPTSSNTARTTLPKIVGKSRSHVAEHAAPVEIARQRAGLHPRGKNLRRSRARAARPTDPEALAQAIVAQGLSVRQAEAVVQERAASAGKTATRRRAARRMRTRSRWRSVSPMRSASR
jgi:ParB family chromosome partitioning protein